MTTSLLPDTDLEREACRRYVAEVLRLNPGAGLYPKQVHLMLAFKAGIEFERERLRKIEVLTREEKAWE